MEITGAVSIAIRHVRSSTGTAAIDALTEGTEAKGTRRADPSTQDRADRDDVPDTKSCRGFDKGSDEQACRAEVARRYVLASLRRAAFMFCRGHDFGKIETRKDHEHGGQSDPGTANQHMRKLTCTDIGWTRKDNDEGREA